MLGDKPVRFSDTPYAPEGIFTAVLSELGYPIAPHQLPQVDGYRNTVILAQNPEVAAKTAHLLALFRPTNVRHLLQHIFEKNTVVLRHAATGRTDEITNTLKLKDVINKSNLLDSVPKVVVARAFLSAYDGATSRKGKKARNRYFIEVFPYDKKLRDMLTSQEPPVEPLTQADLLAMTKNRLQKILLGRSDLAPAAHPGGMLQ